MHEDEEVMEALIEAAKEEVKRLDKEFKKTTKKTYALLGITFTNLALHSLLYIIGIKTDTPFLYTYIGQPLLWSNLIFSPLALKNSFKRSRLKLEHDLLKDYVDDYESEVFPEFRQI